MKTRVNLYLDEFKLKYELFTLGTCFVVWGMSIVLVVLGTYLSKNQLEQIRFDSQQVEMRHVSKKKLVDTLTSERDSRQRDPQLISAIEMMQRQLSAQQAILSELAKQEQLKSQGFSLLMLDLANNQQDDLWLKRIRVEEQQLLLTGGASGAASLPRWVGRLKQAEYFSGKQFDAAKVYRDEEDILNFEIGTLIDGESPEVGSP
jgi:hypothetical protein